MISNHFYTHFAHSKNSNISHNENIKTSSKLLILRNGSLNHSSLIRVSFLQMQPSRLHQDYWMSATGTWGMVARRNEGHAWQTASWPLVTRLDGETEACSETNDVQSESLGTPSTNQQADSSRCLLCGARSILPSEDIHQHSILGGGCAKEKSSRRCSLTPCRCREYGTGKNWSMTFRWRELRTWANAEQQAKPLP